MKTAELTLLLNNNVHELVRCIVDMNTGMKNIWQRINELEARQWTREHSK